jgi:hypothetical protein
MSLVALANRAVQVDAEAAAAAARTTTEAADQGAAMPGQPPAEVSSALQRLVEFIPTETISLFWLAVPAAQAVATWLNNGQKPVGSTWIDWLMFGSLVVLTPVLLVLVYLSGLAARKLPRPGVNEWPWWKAFAAAVAFSTWAFAVPGNPFVREPPLLMAVWFIATLVSFILALLDPIIVQWCGCK